MKESDNINKWFVFDQKSPDLIYMYMDGDLPLLKLSAASLTETYYVYTYKSGTELFIMTLREW